MNSGTLLDELQKLTPAISAGVSAADMMNLGEELNAAQKAGVRLLHFDVMDGHFCPSLTFGPGFIRAVRTDMLKDVHLMVSNPQDIIGPVVEAGADIVTVNIESDRHIHRVFQALGKMDNVNDPERGVVRGAVLNPGTPVSHVEPLLEEVELVMLLAINPGFSGQTFIPATREKCLQLWEMIKASGRDILVAVDGGIKMDNIAEVAGMGADIIAAGSAIFDRKDPAGNAERMAEIVRNACGT